MCDGDIMSNTQHTHTHTVLLIYSTTELFNEFQKDIIFFTQTEHWTDSANIATENKTQALLNNTIIILGNKAISHTLNFLICRWAGSAIMHKMH